MSGRDGSWTKEKEIIMSNGEKRITRRWKLVENKKHPYKHGGTRRADEEYEQKSEVVTTEK